MRLRYLLAAALIPVILSGCTTLRETEPTQTAREQLLLSKAADQASARIEPSIPAGSRIFVDSSNFGSAEEYNGQYAVNAIKTALLKQGYSLAANPDEADTIVVASSGALSIDRTDRIFGLRSTTLPIPLAGPLNTPEIALWKSNERTGVAKFLLTFYDADSGMLQDASGPVFGFSHFDQSSILFYNRTHSNLMPGDVKKRRDQE